jgi:hypothetical protein
MDNSDTTVALAICYSARIILYNIYTCNDHHSPTEPQIPEETEMQIASINGLTGVSHGIYQIAAHISDTLATGGNNVLSKSLPVGNCFYQAASGFAWFIRAGYGERDLFEGHFWHVKVDGKKMGSC